MTPLEVTGAREGRTPQRSRSRWPMRGCRLLGRLSIASGLMLLALPRAAAELYALPARPSLVRLLGLRDVGVGLMLLEPSTTRLGCTLRAASDSLDFVLIARERAKPTRRAQTVSLRLGGALLLVATAIALRARLD
jgi:hypothetical protein